MTSRYRHVDPNPLGTLRGTVARSREVNAVTERLTAWGNVGRCVAPMCIAWAARLAAGIAWPSPLSISRAAPW